MKETEYTVDALLKSKAFSQYQQDFARTVLTKPTYTIKAAKATLDAFFGKDVK
jgi:hypothetical protein